MELHRAIHICLQQLHCTVRKKMKFYRDFFAVFRKKKFSNSLCFAFSCEKPSSAVPTISFPTLPICFRSAVVPQSVYLSTSKNLFTHPTASVS